MADKKKGKTRRVISKVKAKYRSARSRGFLGMPKLGNLKELAAGAGALVVMRRYQPFGGAYKPSLDKVAAGVALNAIKLGNSDLVTSGIKEGLSVLVDSFLGGGLSIGESGGGSL